MKLKTFEENIKHFIECKTNKVLLVKGDWGIGKTHYICKSINNITDYKHVSISLFGLANISDITYQISAKILDIHTKEGVSELINTIGSIPFISQILPEKTLDLAKLSNKVIIFFDDIERTKIKLESIFGLIDKIKNNKELKIIIAVNDDELGKGGEDLIKFKEKVVDTEIRLKSTVDEAIGNIFVSDFEIARTVFSSIKVNNIRAIIKAKRVMDYFASVGEKLDEYNKQSLKKNCLIYAGFYYSNYDLDKSVSELSRKSYLFTDMPLNSLIESYLDSQVIETRMLEYLIQETNKNYRKSTMNDSLKKLRKIIEGSFSENYKEVLELCQNLISNEYLYDDQFLYVADILLDLGESITVDTVDKRLNDSFNIYTMNQYKTIFSEVRSPIINKFLSDKPINTKEEAYTNNEKHLATIEFIESSLMQLKNVSLDHYSDSLMNIVSKDWLIFLKSEKGLTIINNNINEFKELLLSNYGENLKEAVSKLSKCPLQKFRLEKVLYIDFTEISL